MSEDFLARWSRRKQEAEKDTDAKTPASADEPQQAVEGEAPAADSKPVAAATSSAEPAFDLKDLPSIESITAATDIRPFLRPGVPVHIARAAIRRAWTADPKIRDFIGLADYDWDYHATGTAAGCEPLEMTDELRQVVARIIGQIPDERGPDRANASIAGDNSPKKSSNINAEAKKLPDLPQSEVGRSQAAPVTKIGDGASQKVFTALKEEDSEVQPKIDYRELSPTVTRSRHGGALPK